MIYTLGIIILIICILVVFLFFKYSKLKDMKDSLNISIAKIEEILKEKVQLVTDLLDKTKSEKLKNKFDFDENASIIDREDVLFNSSFDINKFYRESGIKGKEKQDIQNSLKRLNSLEEELDGLKDFYNANVLDYNEIFLKKYLNKIFRYLKFNDYKSFKIKKLEEYEIFKN